MGILKQGSQYDDTTEPATAPIEPAPTEEKPAKKKKKSSVYIVGAVVIIFIVLALVYSKMTGGLGSNPASTDIIAPTPEDSDADYWANFDETVSTFTYTDEEKASLRAWGYTGEEIEANEASAVSAAALIEESKKAQEDAAKAISDASSPEYQALLNNTWLGQDTIPLPAYEEGTTENSVIYTTRTYNADYDRVPAHGRTVFLKVYLQDGTYTFMECDPIRYMQLPDSGNIVVSYVEMQIGSAVLITHMAEVEVG